MKYFTLWKENIKHQKGVFAGILILIFIITVSLCAVLTVWHNANTYENEQLTRMGYGDITAWIAGTDILDELEEQVVSLADTGKVTRQQIIFMKYWVNGEEEGSGQVGAYEPETFPYYVYEADLTGIEEHPKAPKPGEVYVPPSFGTLYGAVIGDEVKIEVTGNEDTVSYRIAGFFEDPFMGSAMMGMKTMLMCTEDVKELAGYSAADSNIASGEMMHISKDESSPLSTNEFQIVLNEKTDLKNYSVFIYQKSAIEGFMLVLQNIFAGFLLVFVAVLLFVAILVLSHSITTSIEQDYADMGILRAVGYTKTDLQIIKTMQYLAAVLFGIAAGVPVSASVVWLVNRITVPATGLMVPTSLPAVPCFAALFTVFLLLAALVFGKTAGIGKITPVRAICGGSDAVYFQSRFTLPIGKNCLNLGLAARQLVSGRKQYVSTCVVTALLVFFLSLSGRIGAWVGPDGEGLISALGMSNYDLGVKCADEKTSDEVDRKIRNGAEVKASYQVLTTRGSINHMDYVMNVISDPGFFNLLEGRTCKYDNEILVTETVSKALGVKIGDTVNVSYEENSADFIVSGIYQCANDMGNNFGINMDAFYCLGGDRSSRFYTCYQLEDSSQAGVIYDNLADIYGDSVTLDDNSWSGLSGIVSAMDALGILMYVISIIFILVVVVMTGSKILYKEQRDLGIYKSLGFLSGRLRLMFALRFGIVAAAGAVAGIVFSAVLTDPIVGAMLGICGISQFSSSPALVQMMLPALQVILLFVLFAYLTSGKIRRTGMQMLITE